MGGDERVCARAMVAQDERAKTMQNFFMRVSLGFRCGYFSATLPVGAPSAVLPLMALLPKDRMVDPPLANTPTPLP